MPDPLVAFGLVANAFLSATLLPGASEVLLAGLVAGGYGEPWVLVLLASLGNTLGSAVNWACGRFLLAFRDRRWFPVGEEGLRRGGALFGRWGLPVLLLAWVPVVGDALTVIAGVLGVPFWRFALVVAIGKLGRYAVVAAAALAIG